MKLEIQNILKIYENKKILNNLNFKVKEGELLSILGPSGTGKSTVLKIISGLIAPDEGQVFIDEKDVTLVPPEKRGIGFVFQAPLLFPHMTVEENITFGLYVKKWGRNRIRERIKELLTLLQIEDLANRMPSEISGGQQQRVSIGRSLAPEPEILLMDEPFSSLDPELRDEMGELIKDIVKKYNLTVIFVTHDRNESMALSSKIALLLDGEIGQLDTPHNLFYRPHNKKVAEFMGECNFIRGTVMNNVFSSPVGSFNNIDLSDGSFELCLRPHEIKMNLDEDFYSVKNCKVTGKEVMYELSNGKNNIFVEDFSDRVLLKGQKVGLIFPEEALHFL